MPHVFRVPWFGGHQYHPLPSDFCRGTEFMVVRVPSTISLRFPMLSLVRGQGSLVALSSKNLSYHIIQGGGKQFRTTSVRIASLMPCRTMLIADRVVKVGNILVVDSIQFQLAQLEDMVILVRGYLSNNARTTVGALTVIDVHARDVMIKLTYEKVSEK